MRQAVYIFLPITVIRKYRKKPPFFTVFDHAVTRLSLAYRRVARGRRLVDVTKTL